jgi:antibiotic biosynthesis monooxygenase (ABM) superfamily enzyme
MHAALVAVTIEGDVEKAQANLRENVVPMVRQSPGFVAGYWMEPQDGNGWSVVVFDTEEHARAAAPEQGSSPGPGVTIKHVQFAPVVAHA